LTERNLTPALERIATLAGTVADSFEKGADLMHEMSGIRLGESTVERTRWQDAVIEELKS